MWFLCFSRGRCASASSIADGDNINAAPPHLPQRTDSAGSVTIDEERDSVDTVILFWYGEGERVRREKPYETRGYIYNGVKRNLSIEVVLNRICAFPEKKKRKLVDNFLTYQERKLDQKHAPASRLRESSRTHTHRHRHAYPCLRKIPSPSPIIFVQLTHYLRC